MQNLLRYIRMNKKKIIKVALIAAFLIIILQVLNYFSGLKNNEESNNNYTSIQKETNGTIKSDKSAVSGSKVSTTEIKEVGNKIKEFVDYCNNNEIENAYNLLSEECKEELYPNLDNFISSYYNQLFKEGNRNYSIQNWSEDIYIVKFTNDLLATGGSLENSSFTDYITITEENNEKKLNINSFVGKETIEKQSSDNGINVKVLNKLKYIDYEVYEIEITNNTEDTILLDQLLNKKSIYIRDTNDVKHYAFLNEIIKEELKVFTKYTKKIKIKFDNPYVSNRKIKGIGFSNIVLDYREDNYGAISTTKIYVKL